MALSQIEKEKDIPSVIKHLQFEQDLDHKTAQLIQGKITELFKAVPEMKVWFDGSWQVINERNIYTQGNTYVPDRVMFKDAQAIIVDYKKEKQANKHVDQISGYGRLVENMGYEVVGKYLVYVEEAVLVQVQ